MSLTAQNAIQIGTLVVFAVVNTITRRTSITSTSGMTLMLRASPFMLNRRKSGS